MSIDEFRRRHRISPDEWRAMVETGTAPAIHRGMMGRSMISEEAAQAWLDKRLREWLSSGPVVADKPPHER